MAQNSLPWVSSFNCDEFEQSGQTVPSGCTDVADNSWYGESVGSCTYGGTTHYSQVTSSANRSGSTGRGIRQWVGNSYSNGIANLLFTTSTTVEIRWYQRWDSAAYANKPAGGLHKDVYIKTSDGGNFAIPEIYGDNYNVAVNSIGSNLWGNPVVDPATIMDGNWHYFEIHLTPTNMKFWVDGVKTHDYTGSTSGNWYSVLFGSNTGEGSWGTGCYYVDYDDIAVNSTGAYIGPTGGGGSSATPTYSGGSITGGQMR